MIIHETEVIKSECSSEMGEEANKVIDRTIQILEDCSEIHIRDIHK